MFNASLPEPELLKVVLQPLLEDFLYWFDRTQSLLKNERLDFLSPNQQAELLQRIERTQREVGIAKSLLLATNGQAGVESAVLVPWHQLVLECWQIGMAYRKSREPQPMQVDPLG
jgi:Protein of unknown function (DUF2605)